MCQTCYDRDFATLQHMITNTTLICVDYKQIQNSLLQKNKNKEVLIAHQWVHKY